MRLILLIMLLIQVSNAEAFESFSYSGRLVNANGSPVTGPVNLSFEMAYSSQPGVILCSQELDGVSLISGVFHVKLEFTNCNLSNVLANTPTNHTVSIRVIDRTASPQKVYSFQAIHSVPYSFISQISKQLAQMSAVDGQILAWDDTAKKWLPKTPAASTGGTLTSITAGDGLSGGTITNSGTIAIATDGVTSTHIDDETITNADVSATAEIAQTKISNLVTDLGNKEGKLPSGGLNTDYLDGTKAWQNFDQSVRNTLLIGLGTGTAAPIDDTNTVFEALENLQAQILSNDTAFDGTGQWSKTGDKIFYNTNNVGIGTANPNEKLEVTGNIALSGRVRLKDSGSNYVELKSPTTLGSTVTITLPGSAGLNGQALTSDGSGNLTWSTLTTDSSDIVDGSIVDADIAAGANIAQSKIAGLSTSLTSIQDSISNLNTGAVAEGSNLYFTEARVLGTDLAGLNTTGGAISAADTVLSSIGKLIGNLAAVSSTQSNYVLKSGDSMSGNLQMGGHSLTGLAAPTDDSDAATKLYVDTQTAAIASQWQETGADIYYNAGKVGVGTATPLTQLDVAGTLHLHTDPADNNLAVLSMHNTHVATSQRYFSGLYNNISSGQLVLSTPSGMNFRFSDSASYPLRFYSQSWNGTTYDLTERLRIDGSNGNVSIGGITPANKLDVVGDIGATGKLRLKSTNTNYVELKAPAALGAMHTYTFPATLGASGNALITDGTGNLTWSAVATTATSVGGDLSGTIANAQLVADSVGSTEIANGAVTYPKLNLLDGDIPQAKVNGLVTALSNKEATITTGVSTQYWRGDKTWQTLNTTVVPEGTNQYFTENRVRASQLDGYLVGAAEPIIFTDTLLGAFGKLQAQITANKAAVDAQWTKDGTNLYYNTGSVGIGTTNPTNLLTLSKATATATFNDALLINNPPNNGGGTGSSIIMNAINTNGVRLYTAIQNATAGTEYTNFGIQNFRSGAWVDRFTILGNGNVGIGSIAPTSKLEVVSTNDSAWAAQVVNNGTTNAHGLLAQIGASSTGVPLGVYKGATELFRVSNSGYVGIGTSTPIDPLHVVQDEGLAAGEHWLFRVEHPTQGGVVIGYEADGTNFVASKIRSSSNTPLVLGTTNNQNALTINDNGTANYLGRPITKYNPNMSLQLGNHDWSDMIGLDSGSVVYSSADKGMKTTGSSWFHIKTRMPIDPKGVYRATVRVKKIDGTGTFYVGASSLDANYNDIKTDLANSYNYFAASNYNVPVGTTYTASGTISGHNLATEGSRVKFDPGAKFFDIVIITNYTGSGSSVIESVEVFKEPTPEPWISAAFESGWVDFAGTYAPVSYYKDSDGIVHLRGLAKDGTVGSGFCIFTLPEGYRPDYRRLLTAQSNNAISRIDIRTSGCVEPISGSNVWISLDELSFRAASP